MLVWVMTPSRQRLMKSIIMLVWVITPSRQRLMKSIVMLVWVMTPSRQRARDGESASSPASVSLSARPKLWRRRVRSVGLVFKPLSGVCWPQRCRPAFFFSLFEVKTYLCCCCNCVICLRHYQKQSGITFWMTRCLKRRIFFAVVLLWLLWILPRNPLLRGVGHYLSFRAAVHRRGQRRPKGLGTGQTPSTRVTTSLLQPLPEANEQFFVGAQIVVSLLQTNRIISDVCFVTDHVAYGSSNKTKIA